MLKAVDEKADKAVLIAGPQQSKDEYEFILVKVKQKSAGKQWHLELKLEKDKWKLLDTD